MEGKGEIILLAKQHKDIADAGNVAISKRYFPAWLPRRWCSIYFWMNNGRPNRLTIAWKREQSYPSELFNDRSWKLLWRSWENPTFQWSAQYGQKVEASRKNSSQARWTGNARQDQNQQSYWAASRRSKQLRCNRALGVWYSRWKNRIISSHHIDRLTFSLPIGKKTLPL